MRYLVDADWIINVLAGKRNAPALTRRLGPAGISVSIVTLGEIYEGAFGASDPQRHLASLREFMQLFPLLPLTDPIMERFAALRARLRRQGNLVPDLDLLVAATALEHDLELLTFNVRHFSRIEGLAIYDVNQK